MADDRILASPAISENNEWDSYRAGGKDTHGNTIQDLTFRGPSFCVYITDDETLCWNYDQDVCVDVTSSLAEADVVLNDLRATFHKGSRLHSSGLQLVAGCLVRALGERQKESIVDFYASAREFITARRRESLQIRYLASAFVATGILASTLTVVATWLPEARDFLVAAALGNVGAFLSVAQRFRSLPLERYSSDAYTTIAGISRSLVGAMFGALFLLFQRADVLLGAVSTPYMIYALSVVAGFSERFMPELLAKIEGGAATK